MKKMFYLFMALVMLCMTMPFGAFAAEAGHVYAANVTEAHAGSQISVPVIMDANPGVVALKVVINYDNTKLTLTDTQNGEIKALGSPTFSEHITDMPYIGLWATSSSVNVTATGKLMTLTFKVNEDVQKEDTVIRITVTEAACDLGDSHVGYVNFTSDNATVSLIPTPEYTVTFYDWDDTVLKTQTVKEGENATAPSTPTREGYDFTGWDKSFTNVHSNIDVHATYSVKTFTVTFRDWDESPISRQEVEYGKSATAPANPVREGYMFIMWDTDFSCVKENLTVHPVYQREFFTVVFMDWDGTPIVRKTVAYGESATAPLDPVREGYTFTGWDKDFSCVKSNLEIHATYKINYYTIYYFVDGEDYAFETLKYGDPITPMPEPHKEGQTFSGWSEIPETMPAENVYVYGSFDDNIYTVVFVDWDGTTLSTQSIAYGESATAPADPVREGYTFTGWDKDFSNIYGNTTITAMYKINIYTVTFVDYDGTVLKEEEVEHGRNANAPTEPIRAGYSFTGWDKDFSCVTENITVTAQYKINKYTVIFEDFDGQILKEESVEYGKAATAPADPVREGYKFDGWDKDFSCVTDNMLVTAQYKVCLYTVRFIDFDGSLLKKETVEYGKGATAPENPEREGYRFTGWDKDFSNIKSNLSVYAQYAALEFTVIFRNWDGSVLKNTKVEYGNAATAPENPTRDGYTFVGWDKDFSCVKEDMEVTAVFEVAITLGDINADGQINTGDAVMLLKFAASIIQLDETQMKAADVSHDTEVNTGDAVLILKFAAGMIEEF